MVKQEGPIREGISDNSYLMMPSLRVSSRQTSEFVSKKNPMSSGTAIVPDATASPAAIGTMGKESLLRNRTFDKESQFGLTDVTNHQPRNRFQRHSVSDEKDTKHDPFARKSENYNKDKYSPMPPPKEGMANLMLLQRKNPSHDALLRKKTPPYNPDGYHFTNLSDGTPVYSSSPFYSRWIEDDQEITKDIDDGYYVAEKEEEMKSVPPMVQSESLSPSQRSLRTSDGNLQGILSVDKCSNVPIAQSSCINEDSRCGDDGLKMEEDTGESMRNATNVNDPLFKDIIGHQSVKLRLDEVLLPLALPANLSRSILTGVRSLAASIFMYGPPGCGKVCKTVVDDLGCVFIVN